MKRNLVLGLTLAIIAGIGVVIATTGSSAAFTSPLPTPGPTPTPTVWADGCIGPCPNDLVEAIAAAHNVLTEWVFCCNGIFYHASGTIELGYRYEVLAAPATATPVPTITPQPTATPFHISPLSPPTPTPIAIHVPLLLRQWGVNSGSSPDD